MSESNKYFFSVMIPAFKARYLAECIESILAQTYQNFEVIIVNDASPQDLDSTVGTYKDPRIHYFKNKVGFGAEHVVGNWNKCLEYAKGDYVICMGDDDKLLPNCLEEYAKLIDQYTGIGLLHGWTEIIDENSVPFLMTTHRGLHESAMSLCWHRKMGAYSLQFIGDFCFEREWLVKQGGFFKLPLAWGSDDISALIGASKNGVANTQVPVFQYRRNRYTISSTGNVNIKLQALKEQNEWYDSFLRTVTDNFVDKLYQTELLSKMIRIYDKRIGLTLAASMKENGRLSILHWILNAKKYGISKSALIYAFIQSFKK